MRWQQSSAKPRARAICFGFSSESGLRTVVVKADSVRTLRNTGVLLGPALRARTLSEENPRKSHSMIPLGLPANELADSLGNELADSLGNELADSLGDVLADSLHQKLVKRWNSL